MLSLAPGVPVSVFVTTIRSSSISSAGVSAGATTIPRRHRLPGPAPLEAQAGVVSSIDLNADLAEGFGVWELGDDEAMLDIVTSANLACGFHAGNPVGLPGHLPGG